VRRSTALAAADAEADRADADAMDAAAPPGGAVGAPNRQWEWLALSIPPQFLSKDAEGNDIILTRVGRRTVVTENPSKAAVRSLKLGVVVRRPKKEKTSLCPGVSYDKIRKKWKAQEGSKYLGRFESEDLAIRARDGAIIMRVGWPAAATGKAGKGLTNLPIETYDEEKEELAWKARQPVVPKKAGGAGGSGYVGVYMLKATKATKAHPGRCWTMLVNFPGYTVYGGQYPCKHNAAQALNDTVTAGEAADSNLKKRKLNVIVRD
jgi:hypothetical protein